MKIDRKKIIIVFFMLIFGVFNLTAVYGNEPVYTYKYVQIPKIIADFLLIIQVSQYVVPIVFFITKIIINRINKRKNTLINVFKYLIISIVLFFAIVGLGFLIFDNTYIIKNDFKSVFNDNNFINYNGKIIYYK